MAVSVFISFLSFCFIFTHAPFIQVRSVLYTICILSYASYVVPGTESYEALLTKHPPVPLGIYFVQLHLGIYLDILFWFMIGNIINVLIGWRCNWLRSLLSLWPGVSFGYFYRSPAWAWSWRLPSTLLTFRQPSSWTHMQTA